MELDKTIKQRKSTRAFKPKKVQWKKVLEAIDAANQGPFAGNTNNLHYIIVEDKNSIEKLAKHSHQTWISNAPILIAICSDDTHLENLYGERGRVYSKQQAGAAINTILLKLTEQKLANCWVGAFTDEFVKNALGIPAHIQVEAIIPIGYEKKTEKKKKKKKQLENTLFWESWETKKRPTILKEPPLGNYRNIKK